MTGILTYPQIIPSQALAPYRPTHRAVCEDKISGELDRCVCGAALRIEVFDGYCQDLDRMWNAEKRIRFGEIA